MASVADEFTNGLLVQLAGDFDDGADEYLVVLVVGQVADEHAIDLQDVGSSVGAG